MVRSSGQPPSTASQQALLAMAGDDQALADLYLRCREIMLVRATRLAPDLGLFELEDVVADSLMAAIRMLRSGRWNPEQGSFLGWLDQVVRHDLVDAMRRADRRPAATDPEHLDGLAHPTGLSPASRLVAGEQEQQIVAAVRRALSAINPRYADVLLLRSILGLDIDAVGKELGMQRRQVIDAAYEGRRRLFARLERGAADWDVFVQHHVHRVLADTPAAVRALAHAEPPKQ